MGNDDCRLDFTGYSFVIFGFFYFEIKGKSVRFFCNFLLSYFSYFILYAHLDLWKDK